MFEGLYSWSAVAPALVVLATALVVMMTDLFVEPGNRIVPWLTIAGLFAGLIVSISMWGTEEVAFSGAWKIGAFSIYFYCIFIVAAIVTILFSMTHEERRGRFPGEYWSLITFSVVGMMVMASAADLITLIIGLETMSLCAYVLVGLNRGDQRSSEGALKYFLLGAFASAFLLYGTAFMYGSMLTTRFSEIAVFVSTHSNAIPFNLQVGAILLLVGLGFKVAAVPFHMWAPDAYQAAP
ncbi:NADH-quinone oxidoreductase subunit N, partial [Gemmatimonadota bacterium]